MPLPGKEFNLKSWTDENRLVMRVSGPLNWDEGDELCKHLYNSELRGLVVIDLTDVTSISSGGMAALISVFKYLRSHNGRLQIWCPNASIREVLETAHLDRLLNIQPVAEPTNIFIEVRSVSLDGA